MDKLFNKLNSESICGIAFPPMIRDFEDSYYKAGNIIFETFLSSNKNTYEWLIFSDYVLRENRKINDVITFTIVPTSDPIKLIADLKHLCTKDIKELSQVSSDFLQYLWVSNIFNISFILNKKRKFDHNGNEQAHMLSWVNMFIKQVELWITNEGIKNYYSLLIKDMKTLKTLIERKNISLLRDIYIVASLLGYIMMLITKHTEVQRLFWFSDRDDMVTYKQSKFKNPLIHSLLHNYYHVTCESMGLETKKLVLGIPEASGTMWYDYFNRIPDYICGTIADWDIEANVSSSKFIDVLENLLASNKHFLLFKLDLTKEFPCASRIRIERAFWQVQSSY